MSQPKVFWTPVGVNLDAIGDKRLVDVSDGDTPNIRVAIRMLSIDTPEKAPTGTIRNLARLDAMFAELGQWIASGNAPLIPELAAHLLPRLARANAASAHIAQGAAASAAHQGLVDTFLKRPSGSTRNLFVRMADEPFDRYGRLLAYVAPEYSVEERAAMSRADRATFNQRMVANGHAATFILFPSIPGELDLPGFVDAGQKAFDQKLGAWADPLALTGYEFRSMERLAAIKDKINQNRKLQSGELHGFIERYCLDLTTLEFTAPQGYARIKPYHRIFIWRDDVRRAVAELNLVPAGNFGTIGD